MRIAGNTAYNEAVWRKRGCGSSERQLGKSTFVPRGKCSETPACAKPLGRYAPYEETFALTSRPSFQELVAFRAMPYHTIFAACNCTALIYSRNLPTSLWLVALWAVPHHTIFFASNSVTLIMSKVLLIPRSIVAFRIVPYHTFFFASDYAALITSIVLLTSRRTVAFRAVSYHTILPRVTVRHWLKKAFFRLY
jgi:hypothetical protein